MKQVYYKGHAFSKQKLSRLFIILLPILRIIQPHFHGSSLVYMHTSDVNLIRIGMEGTRIISPDTIQVRFSNLFVHRWPVRMCVGGGDARLYGVTSTGGCACLLWSNFTG
jgi:hypothetical protein